MSDTHTDTSSPFHHGEQLVQARLGVRDIEDWARKVVRPSMPDEHRAFHTSLPFLVIAARDSDERPWVTVLAGADGFVTSPDDQSLVIGAKPVPGDALDGALAAGADIGILGIELETRRRNRVNGRIADDASGAVVCAIDQAFGNCPQYIRERKWRRVDDVVAGTPVQGVELTESQMAWIADADTFFIASGHRGDGDHPAFGMDASHRGGDRGFVDVDGATRLVFPDFAGNNHYNTVGNLAVDSRVGLLFVDFATGSLLQLSGQATIDWDSEAMARIPGARRLISIDIEHVVELPGALSLRWDADADSVRSLRLIEKNRESDDVISFVFEARDGGALPTFEAGQHLPIELQVSGVDQPVRRTYSLSGPPDGERYRISVKRESQGLASRHLHDDVETGQFINARKPAGAFVLPDGEGPVVLVSAGIGATPMVSMLHALAAADSGRPVWFVHGARDGRHHALRQEVNDLATRRDNIHLHVAFSQPRAADKATIDYDSVGRVDGALLADLVSDPGAHYMLCGPTRFMAGVQTDLENLGVPGARIHSESFGPTG